MRFSRKLEHEVIATIEADHNVCVVFPRPMYREDGSIIIYRDNISMTLHRYLHEQIIGPLTRAVFLLKNCDTEGCMNPFHRERTNRPSKGRSATSCPNGHKYTEATTLVGGRDRCALCKEDRLARRRSPNAIPRDRCREGHKLTKDNVYTSVDARGFTHRRCKKCTLVNTRARRARMNGEKK